LFDAKSTARPSFGRRCRTLRGVHLRSSFSRLEAALRNFPSRLVRLLPE
jgi:hypothetical protein